MKRMIGISALALSLFAGSAFADDGGWRDGPRFKHHQKHYERHHYKHHDRHHYNRGYGYRPRVEHHHYYQRPRYYSPRRDYGYRDSYNQHLDLHYRLHF